MGYEIGFFAGGTVSFTGVTAETASLGGSEYACVKLAEALAALGHSVTVYTPHSTEAYPDDQMSIMHKGVQYLAAPQMWIPTMRYKHWDVFVVSREYPMLSNSLIKAKQLVLWNHDVLSDVDSFLEHIYPADRIYCLSEWQKQHYLEKVNARGKGDIILQPDHITLTRNGVDVEGIKAAADPSFRLGEIKYLKYHNPTFLYASRPERGLRHLLRMWPAILEELPNAELLVAYYALEQEQLPEVIRNIHMECDYLLKNTARVRFLGHLSRHELYKHMGLSHAVLYPCIFPEISCLVALEAQACGTPVISTSYAALAESNYTQAHRVFQRDLVLKDDVQHWRDVAGFLKRFMDKYQALERVRSREEMQTFVLNRHSWLTIAHEWLQTITQHFKQRSHLKPHRIIENLIYHSDLLAAKDALLHWVPTDDATTARMTELAAEVESHLAHHHDEPEQYGDFIDIGDAEDITALPKRMELTLDLIAERYKADDTFTLLDVGCGTGRFLYHVMQRFPKAQIMGLDFSEKCLERADTNLRRYFPERTQGYSRDDVLPFLLQGDFLACEAPRPVNTYTDTADDVIYNVDERPDVIFCGEWLEHQVELLRALTHVNRWCKPGGLVIYTVPNGPWEALTFGEAFTKEGHEIRFHVSHFEERDLQEMFADAENFSYMYAYIQRSAIDNSPIGQFVVSYTAREDATFSLPNYERKFQTTRPWQRIGGCLITKNEEHCILKALRGLKRRIDKVYVGDTGSTDRTTELARTYATVFDIGWDAENGGFAAARNMVRCLMNDYEDVDWIYWMDADEELENAHMLRTFLSGDLEIFQAYTILQYHLYIDQPMQRDVPMRIFRNKPAYQWHGLIHEQPMNLERDPDGNVIIFPTLVLPEVRIAHHGNTSDAERRRKIMERNLPLLKRDRIVNPHRELGKLFIMRDICNTVQWVVEKNPTQLTQYYVDMLLDVIEAYQEFKDPAHQNYPLATLFYQAALAILGTYRVPVRGRIPIQAGLVLAAERGALPDAGHVEPQKRWFLTPEELTAYVQYQTSLLAQRLTYSDDLFAV